MTARPSAADQLSDLFSPVVLELFERLVDERVAASADASVSPWMDAPAAADYLAVPVKRVRNLTASGDMPHVREGGRVFYHRGQLDSWRLAQSSGPRVTATAERSTMGRLHKCPGSAGTLRGRTRRVELHAVQEPRPQPARPNEASRDLVRGARRRWPHVLRHGWHPSRSRGRGLNEAIAVQAELPFEAARG